jgi:hypothetical protein
LQVADTTEEVKEEEEGEASRDKADIRVTPHCGYCIDSETLFPA